MDTRLDKTKDHVIVIGPDYHGDWPKDVYLALQDAGVSSELIFTNTVVRGTDNDRDVRIRATVEKIKRIFRNHAKPIFNLAKELRKRISERDLMRRIRSARRVDGNLFVMFLWTPPRLQFLRRLKKLNDITLVLWQGESPTIDANWPKTFPYFDRIFSVGETWLSMLDSETRKKASVLLLASSPAKFFPIKPEENDERFIGDVIFVGYYINNRADLLSVIKDYDLKIFGYRWENGMKEFPWLKEKYHGPLSNEDANRAFNGGKIEISRTLTQPDHPYSISITQREFDIALSKNFQLCAYSPEVEKVFGDSVPMFRTREELKDLVDYYLPRPEERNRLAEKANAIVLSGHTYAHRIRELINALDIK